MSFGFFSRYQLKASLPLLGKCIRYGCALMMLLSACGKETPQLLKKPLPVAIANVVRRDVPIYADAFGYITSPVTVEIRPQVKGMIKEKYIQAGQEVKQGDLLYLIDPAPYQASVDKAKAIVALNKANLVFAKRKLDRYTELIRGDFVPKLTIEEYTKDLETGENQVISGQAELALAEIRLNECKITSPISGRIGLAMIEVGNIVVEDDSRAIVTLMQTDFFDVEFTLPQKLFESIQPSLRRGSIPLEISLSRDRVPLYRGEVVAFDNTFNSQTGMIKLRGRVVNHDQMLWPGQFAYLRLLVEEKKGVLVVPSAAIQLGQQGNYVYIVREDMRVDRISVKTAARLGDWIVIEESLEENMRVVIDGQMNLQPDAEVVIVTASGKVL